jgi:hypothetical protein
MDLAGSEDVEADWRESRSIGVFQDESDILQGQHLPLVQANEHVPVAETGSGRRALGLHLLDDQPAVKLRVAAGDLGRVDQGGETQSQGAPDQVGGSGGAGGQSPRGTAVRAGTR